jgi:hypothetical protein
LTPLKKNHVKDHIVNSSRHRLKECLIALGLLLASSVHAAGFNDKFVAATGDLNSDGLQDIYIRQQPRVVPITLDDLSFPIVLKSDVQPFVLVQQSGGAYSVVSTLTNSQRTIVAQWPRASSLVLQESDLNLDGFRDLIVKGIAGAVGTHNQLVFADTTSGTTASVARRIDPELTAFVQDAYRWVENEGYFEDASFVNNWFTQVNGATKTGWWSVLYLSLWGYVPNDNVPFLEYANAAYDPDVPPHGCVTLFACDFDYDLGLWFVWGTATEHTAVFDNFNDHFNNDAVTFGKGTHASMEVLRGILAAKLQVPSIGGGARALVARESSVDSMPSDSDTFWDDLIIRAVLHDNYCGITEQCQIPATPQSRVDIDVRRQGESSYFSNFCQTSINYTWGTYDIRGYTPDMTRSGHTLERGGPDSMKSATDNDKCTNKPKRIPRGSYSFSIGGTSANNWENVPTLVTTGIGRSAILVHAAAGAQGSIGCILVAKSTGQSGTFAGGKPSSDAALAEIRQMLGYTNQFKYNYGWVTIHSIGDLAP